MQKCSIDFFILKDIHFPVVAVSWQLPVLSLKLSRLIITPCPFSPASYRRKSDCQTSLDSLLLLTHATPRAQLQYTVVATLYPALHRAQLQYTVAATSTRYTTCSTTVHCRSYFLPRASPRSTAVHCRS